MLSMTFQHGGGGCGGSGGRRRHAVGGVGTCRRRGGRVAARRARCRCAVATGVAVEVAVGAAACGGGAVGAGCGMREVGGRRTDSTARHRRWGSRSPASRYGRGLRRLWRRGWRVRQLGRLATHARSGASEHGGAAADGPPPAVRGAVLGCRWGWRSRGGGKAGEATAGAGRVLPAGGDGRVLGVNGRGRGKGSLPAAAEICWTS